VERKINGHTFKDAFDLLNQKFEFVTLDQTGQYESIPAELIKKRYNDVLGLNYSFEPSELELKEINGSYAIVGKGKITIIDDDGNVVCSRGDYGGCNAVIYNENGKAKDLSDDYKSAVADIFKKCCQNLGTGLYIVIERKAKDGRYVKPGTRRPKQQKSYNPTQSDSNNKAFNSNSTEESCKTLTVSALGQIKSKALRLPAKDAEGREGILLLWESEFAKVNQDVLEKLKTASSGLVFKCQYKEEFRANELRFTPVPNTLTID
jgi:hypothetical protein